MSSEGDCRGETRADWRDAGEKQPLTSVSTRQQHIAEMAKKYAGSPLTTLSHHMDLLWLREAYGKVRRDSAPGVDGQTVADYGVDLDANLRSLLERAKSGSYRAPPAKRVHLPKSPTETRPIALPTVENKVLERAVVMLLEPVYEQVFLDCSYGFRPGRSPHMALEVLRDAVMRMEGGWVLDVDIRKFFDTIPKQLLRAVLRQRIGDGVIDRLIGKWLKAGIWEAGEVTYPEAGTPQGSVISPLLSNVYLHEVLDVWFEREIKPKLRGKAELIRFADDFVVVCEYREDAEALLEQVTCVSKATAWRSMRTKPGLWTSAILGKANPNRRLSTSLALPITGRRRGGEERRWHARPRARSSMPPWWASGIGAKGTATSRWRNSTVS